MANPSSPNECAQELARLLNAQAEVCRGILEKSRMQQKLVEDQNEDELLSLLTDKQRLMDKHQALSTQAAPFRQRWEAGLRERADQDARSAVEAAWNSLRETLDEIVRLEDASRAVLEDQKGRVSHEIGRLQRGKLVNKAYGGGPFLPPSTPRYSDKKG
ncbi:MAG: flagellar protein FlgN [Planctomycetota bacterium]|nr:flagellar protein FlgN [Planctomycetota bacterium]